jgi:hypothetical protein
MKKYFILVAVFFLMTSASYAQMARPHKYGQPVKAKATTAVTAPAVQLQSMVGMVDSVVVGDPAKGTKSEIVLDENGQKIALAVKPGTTIYDAQGGKISLDKLTKGEKVGVKFTLAQGGVKEGYKLVT